MKNLPENIQIKFYQLLGKEISIEDFEFYLYENNKLLEEKLEQNNYFQILSFNYNKKDSIYEFEELLKNIMAIDDFYKWKIIKLSESIVSKKIDMLIGLNKLCYIYYKTEGKFVPKYILGYQDDLQNRPQKDKYHLYHPDFLKTELEGLEEYKEDIVNILIELINELKNELKKDN